MPTDDAGSDPEDTAGVLDELVPGLRAAAIDLIDALDDRCDLGAAAADLLTGFSTQLVRAWARTPERDRPLAVLDALRSALVDRHR